MPTWEVQTKFNRLRVERVWDERRKSGWGFYPQDTVHSRFIILLKLLYTVQMYAESSREMFRTIAFALRTLLFNVAAYLSSLRSIVLCEDFERVFLFHVTPMFSENNRKRTELCESLWKREIISFVRMNWSFHPTFDGPFWWTGRIRVILFSLCGYAGLFFEKSLVGKTSVWCLLRDSCSSHKTLFRLRSKEELGIVNWFVMPFCRVRTKINLFRSNASDIFYYYLRFSGYQSKKSLYSVCRVR